MTEPTDTIASLSRQHRDSVIRKSPAWVVLTNERNLDQIKGTLAIQSTVESLSRLHQVCEFVNGFLRPQAEGGFFDPYPLPYPEGGPSSPIRLPDHIAKITITICNDDGDSVDSQVPLEYNVLRGGYKDADLWAGRFDDIFPGDSTPATSSFRRAPTIAVGIRDSAVQAYYNMFPRFKEKKLEDFVRPSKPSYSNLWRGEDPTV